MRELLSFIQKNVHWLLLLLLVILSIILIINNNQFQRSKYLLVAHEVTGRIQSVTSGVQSYINLNSENELLLNRIAVLEKDNSIYKEKIEQLANLSSSEIGNSDEPYTSGYNFIPARVVYNSISKAENYIVINKGSNDGVKADMGIMSPAGIIGVIMESSPNYSIAISILNPKFQLSCKIKGKNYFGPLIWNGKDAQYTNLENLPRHAEINIGDTIVTSGFSAFFPEELPVGIIVDSQKQKNDNYNSAKVKLFTDFNTLNNVLIIENKHREEQINLQKIINK